MFCTNCGATVPAGAANCPGCGKGMGAPAPQGNAPQPYAPAPAPYQQGEPGWFGRFLNFEIMITPSIIKWLFIIGAVVIILGCLIVMFRGGGAGFIGGLIAAPIILVYFRVLCELMIVFFAIHKETVTIKSKMK
jgi:hypothetical protein